MRRRVGGNNRCKLAEKDGNGSTVITHHRRGGES
jgi:hypothetical protein